MLNFYPGIHICTPLNSQFYGTTGEVSTPHTPASRSLLLFSFSCISYWSIYFASFQKATKPHSPQIIISVWENVLWLLTLHMNEWKAALLIFGSNKSACLAVKPLVQIDFFFSFLFSAACFTIIYHNAVICNRSLHANVSAQTRPLLRLPDVRTHRYVTEAHCALHERPFFFRGSTNQMCMAVITLVFSWHAAVI